KVEIPYENGIDFYRPTPEYPESGQKSDYRWIRKDGRKLLSYSPEGRTPVRLEIGQVCNDEGYYGENLGHSRYVHTMSTALDAVRLHQNQQFRYLVLNINCNISSGQRDGQFGTSAFWYCGGVLCKETTIRFMATQRIGSRVMFVAAS